MIIAPVPPTAGWRGTELGLFSALAIYLQALPQIIKFSGGIERIHLCLRSEICIRTGIRSNLNKDSRKHYPWACDSFGYLKKVKKISLLFPCKEFIWNILGAGSLHFATNQT
jgi:hypothetical protein